MDDDNEDYSPVAGFALVIVLAIAALGLVSAAFGPY
jgi:hypothetical protein